MLDYRKIEITIVDSLKDYLNIEGRPFELVRQNQVAEAPPYPYGSYTAITPVSAHAGTYSRSEDGTLYKDILQTWSFTFQSDDQEEALTLAMKAYDFFTAVGLTLLADKGISVRQVRPVTTRDNFISVQYEHRNGLDVTFGLLYTITPVNEVIETVEFNKEV
mgnify:CR=1 FL=1